MLDISSHVGTLRDVRARAGHTGPCSPRTVLESSDTVTGPGCVPVDPLASQSAGVVLCREVWE